MYSARDCQRLLDVSLRLDDTEKTFKDIYDDLIKRNLTKVASIYFDEDDRKKTITYKELSLRVDYISRHLNGALEKYEKGSIIALKVKNCPNWPILFWSILKSGYEVLLIDARLPFENTENLLSQAGAKAIIASEENSYKVPLLRLNDIIAAPEKAMESDSVWGNKALFCSSGTTGEVKIMVMDGENMVAQIQSARVLPRDNLLIMHPGKIRILAMIPFHHIFGFVAVFLWYSYFGKAIVYPNSISSKDVLRAVHKAKVTHLYSVPLFWDGLAQNVSRAFGMKKESRQRMLEDMIAYNNGRITSAEAGVASWKPVQRKVRAKVLGNSIEWCISGGGYLQKNTLGFINGLGYRLANGYGMTELGVASVETSHDNEDLLKGSIGKPFGGYEFKIIPAANDSHGDGELLIKSKTTHKEEIIGGLKRKTSLDDGYFHTGDIARVDGDGRYYIKGRMKDTIISSNGENVYPDEIESYFHDLPHVLGLAVIGVQNEGKEDVCLILDLDNSTDEAVLKDIKGKIDAINSSLSSEKKVNRVLAYRESLPMANNMKVKRFALKEELKNRPENFYDLDKKEKTVISFDGFDEKEVKETLDAVRSIFSKILLLPEFKIGDNDIWNKTLGGDSMSYVSMVNDIDEAFNLTIPDSLYGKLGSVADFAYEILCLRHPSPASAETKKAG